MFTRLRLCTNTNLSWKLCRKNLTTSVNVAKCGHQHSIKKPISLAVSLGRAGLRISAGICLGVSVKTLTARCEAHHLPNRLVGNSVKSSDPNFDWLQFFELLHPYLKELLAAILAALACAALSIHIPRVLGSLINVVATHSGATAALNPFLLDIKGPALRMLSLYGLLAGCTFFYIHLLTRIGEGVAESMKVRLFTKIVRQDIAFFDSHRTGELVNRLIVDVNDFKSAFKMVVSQGLRNVAQVIGCTITLVTISPQMTALVLVSVPTVILTATLLGSFLRKMSLDAKAQGAQLTLLADEALSNMRTVRAFAMEELETEMFAAEADKYRAMNEKLGVGIAAFQAGTNLFLNCMVLSTIYVGGRLLSEQLISPGDLMAYLVALQMLQRSFTQLSVLFGTYIKGVHAGARVFEMTNTKASMQLGQGKIIAHHALIPEVEFRDVTFAYPTRSGRNVLQNFSLHVPPGKTVALVGSSGSGKSTAAWLLERLYDPHQGAILIGGQDIKELSDTWLRGRVLGLISQEPVLFATSVRENIRYGRPDATDAQVEEAARLANAEEFIRKFPKGYDTIVGERGVAVSGGQKQRIAIARALLKDPAILILDEATSPTHLFYPCCPGNCPLVTLDPGQSCQSTLASKVDAEYSALDSESEHLVQSALDKVMHGRTTLVIAHRLSTIQNADLIVVLSNGSIVEMGTHKKLMSQKGIYASFVEQQRLAGQK